MIRLQMLDPDLAALLASFLAFAAAAIAGGIVGALGGHRRRGDGESDGSAV